MWQLLLLSLLSGSGPAIATWSPAENGCTKGATYWCSNLLTAIQCGALEHCMQVGWDPATKEDTCADCKQVIAILIRMAKESSFKKAIQKYLEDECKSFPLHTLVPRCQSLVDTYYAQIIAVLEGQMNPSTICAKLDLCQSDPSGGQEDAFDVLLPEIRGLLLPQQGKALSLPHSQTQGSPGEGWPIPLPMCWLCRSFVGRLESLIPKATIGKAMGQLCRIMPVAIGGMCQCLMEKYTVTIVDMIVAKLGPQLLCGMLLMCVTDENCGPEIPPAVAPLSLARDRCQACLTISDQVKGAIQANSTQAELEGALLAACSSTFLDWEECKSFIYQHQPNLFTLLPKPWDSQMICQELGACAAEKHFPEAATCAQGPMFWCSSLRAAEQCKAVQYCQAHVWL
ncbi:pulmonary surfactant-associated protein B [Sceloporus undulatus]|uniref:pulmonary surfactant-associated protein B n=1 Tax=Sceloporus undulatus TaxID=8520 RepID=UPI001C4CB4CD|nr:pulmonary surfactant-associated protein B [Sceloporus undulatus]